MLDIIFLDIRQQRAIRTMWTQKLLMIEPLHGNSLDTGRYR
jgi:hypothetical protein